MGWRNSLNKNACFGYNTPLIDGTYKLNKDISEVILVGNGKGTKVLKAHPIQDPKLKLRLKLVDVIKAGMNTDAYLLKTTNYKSP